MKKYRNGMIRPIIYMTATRLMLALIVMLGISRLVPKGPETVMIAAFLTVAFALLAFLVYLRMDGLRIPRVKYIRPKKKKDPMRHISSMSDYTDDDPPVTFEDLEPEEKDFCSLVCNVANMVIFGVLSFIL